MENEEKRVYSEFVGKIVYMKLCIHIEHIIDLICMYERERTRASKRARKRYSYCMLR